MKNKRSPAPDSSMASMAETRGYEVVDSDSDEKYTLAHDWQMASNRPVVSQDAAPKNVDAAFDLGLVLRQKL